MNKEAVLESIDSIDSVCLDTEIAVLEAMVSSYEKYAIIVENCDCETDQFDFVVQEGKVLDEVKKKGKKDSNKFVTVLMFIPRLIKTLCEIIKKKLDSSYSEKMKEADKKFNSIKDRKEKEKKVKEVNEKLAGKAECYIDEKSGKIKFKKDPKSIPATVGWLMATTVTVSKVYERIRDEFDYENPSKIRSFIDDLDKAIHGDKSVTKSDIFEGGLEAVGDGLKHITGITAVMTTTAGSIEKIADKMRMNNMISDKSDPKKEETLKNVTELTGKMTKINAMITGAVGSISLFVDYILTIFGIGTAVKEKGDEAVADLYTAVDSYITEDFKKKHPQKPNESDEAYINRLRGEVKKAVPEKEIFAKQKEIGKARKNKAKEEYKQKKQEWRNKGKESKGTEPVEENKEEGKDNG